MFTIEKGVPLPAPRGSGSPHMGVSLEIWNAFQAMDVGDSFVVPGTYRAMHLVHSLAHRFGIRIKTKKIDRGDKRRVWLVSKTRD